MYINMNIYNIYIEYIYICLYILTLVFLCIAICFRISPGLSASMMARCSGPSRGPDAIYCLCRGWLLGCQDPSEFNVEAGRIQVSGPFTNQESEFRVVLFLG